MEPQYQDNEHGSVTVPINLPSCQLAQLQHYMDNIGLKAKPAVGQNLPLNWKKN